MSVTNFLRKKWFRSFEAADVNNDGVITLDDANLFTNRFAEHYKLDEEKTAQLRASFHKTFRSLFLLEKTTIGPEDFVKEMEAGYTRDKVKFRQRMHNIQQVLVDIFDVNNDGKISEAEFVVVLQCFGIVELDHRFVAKFPQSPPGYIPKCDWRDAWVTFYCNEDEGNIKQELPVPEAFGLVFINKYTRTTRSIIVTSR